jgi:hypothetical protein
MKIIFIVLLGFLLLAIGSAQELPPDNTKVEVDIKPYRFEKKGSYPLAIHINDEFEASNVDPETVLLNDCAGPVKWSIADCDKTMSPLYKSC